LPGGVLINEDQNQIRFDINEIDGQSQISSGVKNRRQKAQRLNINSDKKNFIESTSAIE
jgi:hypothetical protein